MQLLSFGDAIKAAGLAFIILIPALVAEALSDMPDGALLIIIGVCVFVLTLIYAAKRYESARYLYEFFSARPHLMDAIKKIQGEGIDAMQLIQVLRQTEVYTAQKLEQNDVLMKQNQELEKQNGELQKQVSHFKEETDATKKQATQILNQMKSNLGAQLEEATTRLKQLEGKYAELESKDPERIYRFCRGEIGRLNGGGAKKKAQEVEA